VSLRGRHSHKRQLQDKKQKGNRETVRHSKNSETVRERQNIYGSNGREGGRERGRGREGGRAG
jgi:hypothetical protein